MLRIMFILLFSLILIAQDAEVKFVIGTVEIQRKGESQWIRLKLRGKVNQGDKIKSSFQSRAEIITKDKTIVRIRENSMIEFREIKKIGDKESSNDIGLFFGSIFTKFSKLISGEKENTVQTPTAVAAIRGTSLDTEYGDDSGETTIYLYSGLIQVKTKKSNNTITPGNKIRVDNQGNSVVTGHSKNENNTGFPQSSDKKDEDDNKSPKEKDQEKKEKKLFLELYQNSKTFSDFNEVASGIEISGLTLAEAQVNINGESVTAAENGFFQAFLSPVEGTFRVSVRSTFDGKSMEKVLTFRVNISDPEMLLDQTQELIYSAESIFPLGIQVSDITPNDLLTVYINGKMVKTGASPLNFTEQLSLVGGRNNISIEAKDEVNHRVGRKLNIIVDGEAPEVRILSGLEDIMPTTAYGDLPPGLPGFPYRISPRLIFGIITDKQPSSGVKDLYIQGQKVTLRPDGSFQYLLNFDFNLLNSKYKELKQTGGDFPIPIRIEVSDNAGNRYIEESYQIIMKVFPNN